MSDKDFTLRASHTKLKAIEKPDVPHIVSRLVAYAVRDTERWQDESKAANKVIQLSEQHSVEVLGTGYRVHNVFIRCNVVGVQLEHIVGMQVELPQ